MFALPHALNRNDDGAVAVYVAIIIAVLVGFVGLSIDGGRLFTTNTQAQAAADAAALAAASQLDGSPLSIGRATKAAQTTPLVQNAQDFSGAGGTVRISNIRFLDGLPPDGSSVDPFVTADPTAARFVEVTTESLAVATTFIRAVGAADRATTAATAVAGFDQVVCEFPPLMICNPWEESSLTFPPPGIDVRGTQVLAKTKGGSAAWGPGDFGLLDPPDGNTGAKEVAEKIATSRPAGCYKTRVDIRPGEVDSMRSALNTRFDIYENPYFKNAKTDSQYRPARNVTKGKVKGANSCDDVDPTPPAQAMKLPRDDCFDGLGTGCTAYDGELRIGSGQWDRTQYWSVNHPSDPQPIGYAGFSRFDVYRWEIDNNKIPDNSGIGGEKGLPQCHQDSPTPASVPDRRVLYLAVINCEEQGIGGAATDVSVEAFVKMFLTEPVITDPSDGTKSQIWLEFVDVVKPGHDDGILHDLVQLYR